MYKTYMVTSMQHIEAYILAGGQSSRMGSDKALCNLNGIPMISCIATTLRKIFNKVSIIANTDDYAFVQLPCVQDVLHHIGPAAGVHAALCNALGENIFIITCDMPLVNRCVIEKLHSHHQGQITIPTMHGQLHPLCGFYHTSMLPRWLSAIESGEKRLHTLVEKFEVKKVEFDTVPWARPYHFMNVNTPQELAMAEQKLLQKNMH